MQVKFCILVVNNKPNIFKLLVAQCKAARRDTCKFADVMSAFRAVELGADPLKEDLTSIVHVRRDVNWVAERPLLLLFASRVHLLLIDTSEIPCQLLV